MEGHSLLYTVPLHPEMIKMGSFSKVEQQSITKALERASTGTTSTALDPQVSAMLPMFQGKGASNNSSISLQYFFIKACGDVENACGVMDPSEWWNANHKSFKGVAKLARVWLAGSMVLPCMQVQPLLSTNEDGTFNSTQAATSLWYAANQSLCFNCLGSK
jgi:hypothetical protein